MCFHEGTGSYYSTIEPRFGENRLMRHVASHSTEMQLALIAFMLGGVFEFYPRLKVAFLEAQSWWVPGLLGRIEWDMRQHHDSDAPYLKLTPLEYWQRNCFSAIESGEKEVGSVVELLGGADNICVSSDFPHFDSSFPEVSTRVMTNPSITLDIAGKILSGGARLYGFGEEEFAKADRRQAPRQHRRRARPGGSEVGGTRQEEAHGTRRFSDPRQRSPHDGARRPLGALARRALSAKPAAVFRRAARAAQQGRGRQGQRRLDHGHGGAGAGDPGAQHAAGRDGVEPRIAPPQPGPAPAFPGGAGARLRRGLDPDRDGYRGDRCRGHVRHARPADPVPRRSGAGLRRGAGARLQQLGRRLLQDRPDAAQIRRAARDARRRSWRSRRRGAASRNWARSR